MNRIQIIEKTKDFLVVYKPSGIPVQTARVGEMDVEHWLKGELYAEEGREPYLAVVHRLDQPVEGLLVFARNRRAAASLSQQVQSDDMRKEYLAVAAAAPAEDQGRLVDDLQKDGRNNSSRVVPRGTAGAKRAELEYRCLQRTADGRALLGIRLRTGRHHQIRVQLAQAGMPLAGDRKYGGSRAGRGGLGLCACTLSFLNPSNGQRLWFRCEPKGEQFRDFDCAAFIKD